MNVKELRGKAKLSQQELSDKTGIPKGRIAQWEVGNSNPKKDDYDILIKFFIAQGILKKNEAITEDYDVAVAVKKMEAISEVTLSAVSEILAKLSDRSATVVREELQSLVDKRLGQ